ncbi:glutamate--tRNA ligase [Williamsoniiplasma lucivorax]|uniref:Glutamate--tRNA ligase n=1 Tax=Williamsoniiplasma lucivorax TaxID=209274 RepID=A0A2S5RFD1_9MOLU|nr:glutamate--tRNA ligase [Williamsoniiplasma lucivorax]PPE06023.1 glutamyl-tRNA synthetase [Williamsoniiplasma lucivorax]
MKKIRLRYAPSPTGFLHIGNTRTALMNYLFAKHFNGDFIVRIEDTDLERNVEGAIESQFANLNWLGIIPDESFLNPGLPTYGKYMQSQKFDHYQKLALDLVAQQHAYKCFCTPEELEADYEAQVAKGIVATKYNKKCLSLSKTQLEQNTQEHKPFSIRFNVPEKSWTFHDLVRGDVTFQGKDLGDFVILKSNGIPTYNFAVVVDDYDMQISHVIRGEEHISNTPRQMMIFDAFGWNYPQFAHLTLIVDASGKKLSKRSGNALFFIEQYQKQGYLPEAIFNYIALLGWSPGSEQEIFSKAELIKIFDETRFSKSPSTFDMTKMTWINSQYMKALSDQDYLNFVKKFIDQNQFDLTNKTDAWLNAVLLLFKKEIDFGEQINHKLDLFFDTLQLSDETKSLLNQFAHRHALIDVFENKIRELEQWNLENIKLIIKNSGVESESKGKDLFMPIRIYTSKTEHGPSLVDCIYLLGKEKVLANIDFVKQQ